METRLEEIGQHGLPDYFDQQRFGSLSREGEPISKRILRRDAEGALRAYLSEPFVGDSAATKRFKRVGAEHRDDWDALFAAAPRPSNYRSVLTYVRDHPSQDPAALPTTYRKALNLVTRHLLSLYLAAYQSLLWNRIAGRWLSGRVGDAAFRIDIARERLPLYHALPDELARGACIALPSRRALYLRPELMSVVEEVLAEERLAPNDLKARMLDKAYLPNGTRALLLFSGYVRLAAQPRQAVPGAEESGDRVHAAPRQLRDPGVEVAGAVRGRGVRQCTFKSVDQRLN